MKEGTDSKALPSPLHGNGGVFRSGLSLQYRFLEAHFPKWRTSLTRGANCERLGARTPEEKTLFRS